MLILSKTKLIEQGVKNEGVFAGALGDMHFAANKLDDAYLVILRCKKFTRACVLADNALKKKYGQSADIVTENFKDIAFTAVGAHSDLKTKPIQIEAPKPAFASFTDKLYEKTKKSGGVDRLFGNATAGVAEGGRRFVSTITHCTRNPLVAKLFVWDITSAPGFTAAVNAFNQVMQSGDETQIIAELTFNLLMAGSILKHIGPTGRMVIKDLSKVTLRIELNKISLIADGKKITDPIIVNSYAKAFTGLKPVDIQLRHVKSTAEPRGKRTNAATPAARPPAIEAITPEGIGIKIPQKTESTTNVKPAVNSTTNIEARGKRDGTDSGLNGEWKQLSTDLKDPDFAIKYPETYEMIEGFKKSFGPIKNLETRKLILENYKQEKELFIKKQKA